jgi:hypothetical protein
MDFSHVISPSLGMVSMDGAFDLEINSVDCRGSQLSYGTPKTKTQGQALRP